MLFCQNILLEYQSKYSYFKFHFERYSVVEIHLNFNKGDKKSSYLDYIRIFLLAS